MPGPAVAGRAPAGAAALWRRPPRRGDRPPPGPPAQHRVRHPLPAAQDPGRLRAPAPGAGGRPWRLKCNAGSTSSSAAISTEPWMKPRWPSWPPCSPPTARPAAPSPARWPTTPPCRGWRSAASGRCCCAGGRRWPPPPC
ncbi:MAG: hypothetical protein L6R48_02020 [Planctomycetes bacterium]|nr:hypothetical protein [Planctomycetota bacterium]